MNFVLLLLLLLLLLLVVQYRRTKLNTFISAVLSVNFFSSARESYIYKLQQSQFGTAKHCKLPAAPHFFIYLLLFTVSELL